jgi:hypothetical protein
MDNCQLSDDSINRGEGRFSTVARKLQTTEEKMLTGSGGRTRTQPWPPVITSAQFLLTGPMPSGNGGNASNGTFQFGLTNLAGGI